MWRLCLPVMLIGAICVCSLPGDPSSMSKLVTKREAEQRYCGTKLAAILRYVCNGTYFAPEAKRKRDTGFFENMQEEDSDTDLWMESQDVEEFQDAKFPFNSHSEASTFKNRRFRREDGNYTGIVDECCVYKGCTLTEVAEYCAPQQPDASTTNS